MSRARAAAHVSLTAALLVLAFAWVSSAVPLVAVDTPHAAVTVADEPIAPPSEPRLVHKVNPAYPEDARAEGVEGVFLVNLTIGRDGAISGARVAASAPTPERLSEIQTAKGRAKWTPADQQGDARLAQAALDAVNQWRYQPMLKDGKPVNVEATVTVRFKLQ